MTHDLAAVIALLAILAFTALAAYGFGYKRGLADGFRGRLAHWARYHQGQR